MHEYNNTRKEMTVNAIEALNRIPTSNCSSAAVSSYYAEASKDKSTPKPSMSADASALLNSMAASSSSSSANPAILKVHSGVSPKAKVNVDEFEVQEMPLVSPECAQQELKNATINLQSHAKRSHNDLLRAMHRHECAKMELWVSHHNAQQLLESSKQQGASQEILKALQDKVQELETLNNNNNRDYQLLFNQARADQSKLWRAFSFTYDHSILYRAQALLAHSNYQKVLQDNKKLRSQIKQLTL